MHSIEMLRDFVSLLKSPMLILNNKLKIFSCNKAFLSKFKIEEKLEGRSIYKLWILPGLKKFFEDFLLQKEFVKNLEVEFNFEKIGRRTIVFSAENFQMGKNEPNYVIIHVSDITDAQTIKNTTLENIKIFSRKIDDIDCQIINELSLNGRLSLLELSRRVLKSDGDPMSDRGIKNRLTYLIDEGILRVQGNIDVKKLNFFFVFTVIEFKDYDGIKEYYQLRTKCPRLFLIAPITGEYDLIMGLLGRSVGEINNCINNCELINGKSNIKERKVLYADNLIIPRHIPLDVLFTDNEYKCKKFVLS